MISEKTNTNKMSIPQLPQEMVNKILYDFKGFQPYPFLKEFKDIINIMKYPDDYIWDEGVERKTMGWPHGLWINRYLDDEGIYIGKETPWKLIFGQLFY